MVKLIPEGKKTGAEEGVKPERGLHFRKSNPHSQPMNRGSKVLFIVYIDEGANHEHRQG